MGGERIWEIRTATPPHCRKDPQGGTGGRGEADLAQRGGVEPRNGSSGEDMGAGDGGGERSGVHRRPRMDGVAAGATADGGEFLGELATVMDAEVLGIAGAWEEGYRVVASDSQAAIKRCVNLTSRAHKGRSWIDERAIKAAKGGSGWELVWVKGHSGIAGNELAGMAMPDWEGGGPLLRVRKNPERGALVGGRMRGREEEEVGGSLDRQRILCGGH